MGRIYLIRLENRNIVVINYSNKKMMLKIGGTTKMFSKEKYEIIREIKEKGLDDYILENIMSKKMNNSICEAHCIRNMCFVKIDNSIWNLGYIDEYDLIEYDELYFY